MKELTECFIIATVTPEGAPIVGCVRELRQVVGEIVNLSGDHRTAASVAHWLRHPGTVGECFPEWHCAEVFQWPSS